MQKSIRTKKKKMQYQGKKAFLFLAPSFAGVAVFVLLPFADAIRRSFIGALSGKFVGLRNYEVVVHNAAFQLAAKNTGRFLVVCIPLLLLISLLFAVIVNSLKKHNTFFKTIFLIPVAVPVASVVLLWKVFFAKAGLISHMLYLLGCGSVDLMGTDKAFYILVFSYIWKNTGYDMVLWLAGLSGIPPSLYEAAKVDGAGSFESFRYITIPELIPTVYITTVLSVVNSFKIFRETYLIAGSYPQESIYMLQHIFNNWFMKLELDKMCAAAVLLAAAVLVFILLLQKIDSRW